MEDSLALIVVTGIGLVGGTARYLHEAGMHDGCFDGFRYLSHTLVGGFVALIAGFFTTHFGIEGPLQNALVGLAALSSREILDTVPSLFVKVLGVVSHSKGDLGSSMDTHE